MLRHGHIYTGTGVGIPSSLLRATISRTSTSTTGRRQRLARCQTLPTPSQIQRRTWTSLTLNPTSVTVHALNDTAFPYVWLRDACQSPECVHPSTRQKLGRTSDVNLGVRPAAGVKVNTDGESIDITWEDGHRSTFTRAFLERHASRDALAKFHRDTELAMQAWTRESISSTPDLFVPYADLGSPAGLDRAITQLVRYGLLFVRGVPNTKTVEGDRTAEGECELRVLAEKFGEIRQTFYGRVWDVVSREGSKNIAYTDLDLGLHMDLLYFQHPPRYQILHCLRNRVVGGTSIFVDALHAAWVLRETHPEDFDLLTKTPVAFHYINDGHHLQQEHFTIQLAQPTSSISEPEISHINYSPPFQAPLPLDTPEAFFPALRRFADLLGDARHTYEYTLQEGDAVLFDNRRVLHARTAFRDKEGGAKELGKEGEPTRWLKGCYLEADALLDRVRVLKARLEKEKA